MKKCPFCAEKIQDEAIVCRYCGRDLPKIPAVSSPSQGDPSTGLSLLFGFLVLVFSYGFGALVLLNFSNYPADLTSILIVYQVFVSIAVSSLAVTGLNPRKGDFFRYLGMFILSAIPILGWLVIYWAGKGVSRKYNQDKKTVIVALIILFASGILCYSLSTPNSLSMFTSVTSTPTRRPTATPIPTNILWDPLGIIFQTPPQGCISWNKVTRDDIGSTKCVYGKIDSIVSIFERYYLRQIRFDPINVKAFVINVTNSTSNLNRGDCVYVVGVVEFEGMHSYIDGDVQLCS